LDNKTDLFLEEFKAKKVVMIPEKWQKIELMSKKISISLAFILTKILRKIRLKLT
jgi:tellurite resistance-related uncharacterized protein